MSKQTPKSDWLREQREKQYDEIKGKAKKTPRTGDGGAAIGDYNSGADTGTKPKRKRGRPRKAE